MTGELLQARRRWSDLIEDLHDGSILDEHLRTRGEPFKLIYSSLIGLSLIMFTLTGFWIWYTRRQISKQKNGSSKQLT